MSSMLFTGFRVFIEDEDVDYRFSNRARTLYHRLNVSPGDVSKMGAFPVAPNILAFLRTGAKPNDADSDTVKWYKIVELGDNFARIQDVTGACDTRGGNKDNVMAQCSSTHGEVLTLTGKQLDWLTTHIAGQAQGGMGGLGGGMGGLGGGMPPPMPATGGGTPPPAPKSPIGGI